MPVKNTERVVRALFFARYEATKLGWKIAQSEHLLLGLIREDRALIQHFLQEQSPAAVNRVRDSVMSRTTILPKVERGIGYPELSFESGLIVRYMEDECRKMHHHYISTEHLLLGILRADTCLAAQILANFKMELGPIRAVMAEFMIERAKASQLALQRMLAGIQARV